ncbi:MAG: hypothetical protein EXR78_02950 [Deltaproteobacteria bacterium]|nr:hypothetical protein [Deltaproteobacteria bacterium]
MNDITRTRHFLSAIRDLKIKTAPKMIATSSGMRAFVSNMPGAIGYVRADELDGSVKPVRVDGRLPSEPGYELILQE